MPTNQDRRHPARKGSTELQHWIAAVHGLPAVRTQKIAALRQAIDDATLDEESSLDATIDRMIAEFDLT